MADVTLCGSEFQTETAEEENDLDCAMALFLHETASLEEKADLSWRLGM